MPTCIILLGAIIKLKRCENVPAISAVLFNHLQQGWPTCFDWDRLENFLIIRDGPVDDKVTSTKCHEMQRFSCKWFCLYHTFTIENSIFVFTTHVPSRAVIFMYFLEYWLKRFLQVSCKFNARSGAIYQLRLGDRPVGHPWSTARRSDTVF